MTHAEDSSAQTADGPAVAYALTDRCAAVRATIDTLTDWGAERP